MAGSGRYFELGHHVSRQAFGAHDAAPGANRQVDVALLERGDGLELFQTLVRHDGQNSGLARGHVGRYFTRAGAHGIKLAAQQGEYRGGRALVGNAVEFDAGLVFKSGGGQVTMAPLAPALLTTATPWGQYFCDATPKARASASVPPPAANGTTSSISISISIGQVVAPPSRAEALSSLERLLSD